MTLPVEGMTCAACQASVQRALAGTPGVSRAAVNLMTHEATIDYDPGALTPARLVDAINDTGYQSHLPDTGAAGETDDTGRQESAQRREYATLLTHALVSLALGIAAMLLSMPLMSAGAHAGHSADPLVDDLSRRAPRT